MPEHDTIDHGPLIHAATEKTTPVDADEVGLVDSAASNVLKRLTWSNIKATLKTYFDTLYSAVTHRHLVGWSSYALGNGALSSLTSGSYNVAIGDFAANKVTTGSSVIAIGNSAAGNVKGVKNVAIGAFALMSEGAGANNVAIGGDALLYVENAYGSVAIGKDAGSYIADGTTPRTHGGYDVFIGYRAKSLNNTSYQNEIVIGYDAIGHGANTVTLGNDGITHTHLKGAVSADDQPKFLAVLSANHLDVTGDGTVYNILETWTEIEDVGGCFSSGVYTAKKSGLHLLTGIVSYSNIT